jgi:hypothetical protein
LRSLETGGEDSAAALAAWRNRPKVLREYGGGRLLACSGHCLSLRWHNHTMSRSLRRWIADVLILLLLCNAAVPLMASAAAGLQGKPVAEICDIYGVALPSPVAARELDSTPKSQASADPHHGHHGVHVGHAAPDPSAIDSSPFSANDEAGVDHRQHATDSDTDTPRHATPHRSEHCALSGLAAFAPFEGVPEPVLFHEGAQPSLEFAQRHERVPDACARWAALLRHGPPVLT